MADITRKLGSWLHNYLKYDPVKGEFYWKTSGHGHSIGDRAGSIYANGYRYIQLDGLDYRAARLAWFMVTGEDPFIFVDHFNKVRDDDAFENLRLATNSQNQANAWWSTNTSGFKGVSWQKSRRLWIAMITINGKAKNLGRFATRVEAAKAYRDAAIAAWGEFSDALSDEAIEELDRVLPYSEGASPNA